MSVSEWWGAEALPQGGSVIAVIAETTILTGA